MSVSETAGTPPPPDYRRWNILAGVVFALVALILAPLVGLSISAIFDNTDGQVTWLTYFIGVFLTGCLFWWLLVSRPLHFTLMRGATAGVLVAVFSYPVVLTLAELFQRHWSAGEAQTLVERFINVLMLTALTLLTTGFAATLVMAATGAALMLVLLRLSPATARLKALHITRERSPFMRGLSRVVSFVAVGLVTLLVLVFAFLSLMPLAGAGLKDIPPSAPAADYASAVALFGTVEAGEAKLDLHPRCHSTLLTHGQKVARVVVLFHGLTNCPAQYDELGPQLFALGYNVYVPRLPGHGEADPMTLALADLTAEDLAATANQASDIATGLGDEVVVVGLSAGGTMTAWLGQERADIGQSISAAPFFGPYVVPAWATNAATNLLLMLPNLMVWWNPLDTEPDPNMDYAYPRYATHALAQIMRLGRITDGTASREAPKGQGLAMLLNDADVAVSNALAQQLIGAWRGKGAEVGLTTIPLSRRLPHDLMDPRQTGADTGFVYPLLIDMINAKP